MAGKREHVLVLTQFYAPEPNFITEDVAQMLAEHADVTVITSFPNYPFPHFYDGRRHFLPRKSIEGRVTVWRVPMIPDRSRSQLRRAVSYASFTIAATLVAPFVAGAPTRIWVYNIPYTITLAALWFRMVHGSRMVFTYSDVWPETFLAAGVSRAGKLIDFLFWLRRTVNRLPDHIIGSTRGALKLFQQEGVPSHRLHYIPVWVQGTGVALSTALAAPPRVVYAGNMGINQNLVPVIEGAAELMRRGSPVRFDFYGYGVEEETLRALAMRLGATNVAFHGRVSPEEVFRASSEALAQVVTLRADPMFEATLPSKLSFCLAAGAPILYFLSGESAEVARQSGAAFAFDDQNAVAFADRVEHLLSLTAEDRAVLRSRLLAHYDSEFEREMLLSRYRRIILGDA